MTLGQSPGPPLSVSSSRAAVTHALRDCQDGSRQLTEAHASRGDCHCSDWLSPQDEWAAEWDTVWDAPLRTRTDEGADRLSVSCYWLEPVSGRGWGSSGKGVRPAGPGDTACLEPRRLPCATVSAYCVPGAVPGAGDPGDAAAPAALCKVWWGARARRGGGSNVACHPGAHRVSRALPPLPKRGRSAFPRRAGCRDLRAPPSVSPGGHRGSQEVKLGELGSLSLRVG